MMKNLFLLILLSFLCSARSLSQSPIPDVDYKLHIKKAKGKITLDGVLDEPDWAAAELASPFWQSIPYDTSFAITKTESRWTFDDNNIYISAKCFQKRDKYVVLSLKRDFGPGTTDLFGVIIDPFADKQNAFSFATSPFGVQREGLISNGNVFTTDWDNKWSLKIKNEENFWTVEMAIPFKTIRYNNSENSVWNINMLRYDQSRPVAERSTWAYLPRFASGNNIAFSGQLIWDNPPPKPSSNVSVIPYLLGSFNKDFLNKKPLDTEGGIGGDAKIAITSALNLDLTINPDFAQVEVDKQVTNLSRFELFFPERRQFFLENADLFGSFGFDNINPMFTRRIGLATDKDGNTVKVPILLGARLSGKLDNNWRIGVMDIQTGVNRDLNLPATNFLATAIQRKIFSRSLLSFTFINKNNFNSDTLGNNTWELDKNGYNRVLGLDYNLASKDGKWQGKFFYHRSISTPSVLNSLGDSKSPFATAGFIRYNNTNFNFETGIENVGKSYNAEVGYVPRRNYYRIEPQFNFVFYPKSTIINSYSFGMDGDSRFRRDDYKTTDWDFSPLEFFLFFKNNAKFSLIPCRWDYTYLDKNFDPTNTGGKELLNGTNYTYRSIRTTFQTDTRKHLSALTQWRYGQYFNGKINSLQTTLSYRLQPYGVISLDVNYNYINLPEGFNDRKLWLIGPKFDMSFNKDLYFTTFIQYNNQRNNINLNARLQWRFAPVSDLFIVYTDNYFAVDDITNDYRAFQVKNRGLVLKCTYWLNL